MKSGPILAAVMAFAIPMRTSAQNKPDLSGTWTFDERLSAMPPPGELAGGLVAGNAGRYAPPTMLLISQRADTFTVEGSAFQQKQPATTYRLDGTEATLGGPSGTTKAKAAWDGDKLRVTATRTFAGPQGDVSVVTEDAYSLLNGTLVLEHTQQVTGGGRMLAGRFVYGKGTSRAASSATARTRPAAPEACPEDPILFGQCVMEKAKKFAPPRTADSKPDLQGYWAATGALTNVAPGFGIEAAPPSFGWGGGNSWVVDPPDRKIPYQAWALAERERRRSPENALEDPQVHCYNAGVPRQMTFLPYQIIRAPNAFVILHEVSHSSRIIYMDGRPHLPSTLHAWQGDSIGRWEGDTLVADTTNNNGMTYLDLAHNFVSRAARVVERFTLVDQNTIHYTATIDDPKVFTRPWTLAIPQVRQQDKGYEILESACHEENQDLEHIGAAIEKMKKEAGR